MSDSARQFLFVVWDGGGTVPPMLALANRMAGCGHSVGVLGPRSLQTRVESAGCSFLPYRSAPDRDPRASADKRARGGLFALLRRSSTPASTVFAASGPYADDVSDALKTQHADAVVTDYILFGAYIAAERAGLPCAALVPTIYPLPARGLPPFGSGFSPARGLAGRMRDTAVNAVFQRLWNASLGSLNQTRKRFGLARVASIKEQMLRAQRVLILSSQAFDFPATLPANVRYVGPQLDDVNRLPTWQTPWGKDDPRPLVLVSLSITYQAQEELLRRLLSAVADVPARILMTLGPALQVAEFQPPPNVVLAPFVPHLRVLPKASLAVTHGGHGTVLGALACGVPLVCIPMGRDQGDVAARVVWRGVGVRISRKAPPHVLRAAIMQVLEQQHYRDAARAVASAISEENRTNRAAEELEELRSETTGFDKSRPAVDVLSSTRAL